MIYSVPPFSLIKKGVIFPQFYKKRSYKIILFPQINTPVLHMPHIYSKLNTFKKHSIKAINLIIRYPRTKNPPF